MVRVTNVAVQIVMEDVADEEERGEEEGRDHGCAVSGYFAGADEGESDKKRRGAQAVEHGVERGERQLYACGVGGGMLVD